MQVMGVVTTSVRWPGTESRALRQVLAQGWVERLDMLVRIIGLIGRQLFWLVPPSTVIADEGHRALRPELDVLRVVRRSRAGSDRKSGWSCSCSRQLGVTKSARIGDDTLQGLFSASRVVLLRGRPEMRRLRENPELTKEH